MKPIKPKPLSKKRLAWLHACAVVGEVKAGRVLSVDNARAILAALEHAKAAPLYQCRNKCALLFTHEHERDVHEADCG